jgi:RNA polymerase sigma-70 factor (ECF subfamily)
MSERGEHSEILTATPAPATSPQHGADPDLTSKLARERALIARITAGEKDLFYELVRPYERAVFLAANAILQNESDAEEAAQEAVLKAFMHLDRFRGDARFSTWLIQIVINESRMKRRKERKHLYESIDETRTTDEENDYKPQDLADWREIPSEALQQKELRDALRRAIDALSPIYRQVFILRDVQQMSITETATALGITEASVKTRLLRARLQVRDSLAPGYDGKWTIGDGHWTKARPW